MKRGKKKEFGIKKEVNEVTLYKGGKKKGIWNNYGKKEKVK